MELYLHTVCLYFLTETEQNRQEPRRNGRRFLRYVERHSRSLGGRQTKSKVLLFEPKRGTYTSFYRFRSDAKRLKQNLLSMVFSQ